MKLYDVRCVLALALALGLACAAVGAWADQPLKPCRLTGIQHEVRCGVVTRALNPAEPHGRQIDVHYAVVPALARRKLPDPVFLFAGGPGQSAISLASQVMPLFARLNNRRDIVFVDQRGTGWSAPLECEDTRHSPITEQADPERQFNALMQCRDMLRRKPYGDLRFFTTPIAMQDVDAVRQALGFERINIVAASYGTRAALDYQRQFPASVRRSVLDGVAPSDMVLPVSVAVDGQAAFNAMLAACDAEPACKKAHPHLREDWQTLLSSLPRTATAAQPLTGEPETFTLTRGMVMSALRGPLYLPSLTAALPQVIADAARGRFEPLMGLSSMFASRRGMSLAMGMHFSVVCAEDYPLMHAAPLPSAAASGIERDYTELYARVCAQWPHGEVPAAFYRLTTSATPTLLLSGGADPVTPPRHGERVARALGSKARHIVVPHAGHGVMSLGCTSDVLYRFIDAADDAQALAVDAECATRIPRPPAYQPLAASPQGDR